MLSSLLRPKKGRRNRDRSPFSSPYAGIQASPIAAQRSTQEERRRAAADFDGDDSLPDDDGLDEEEEENDEIHVQDEDGDEGEGDHGETTPLLPIFSAAQLGMLWQSPISFSRFVPSLLITDNLQRRAAGIQPYPYRTTACGSKMRDYAIVGSAPVTTGFAIPSEANTAANFDVSLFQSYTLRSNGQLFAVRQRGAAQPWQQWR